MLGFIAAGFALGATKAIAYGARGDRGDHSLHAVAMLGLDALSEELVYRVGVERVGMRGLGALGAEPARLASSILFGLGHANPIDAAVGGYLYSRAYDAGGLGLSTLAHLAHNLGVVLLSR